MELPEHFDVFISHSKSAVWFIVQIHGAGN